MSGLCCVSRDVGWSDVALRDKRGREDEVEHSIAKHSTVKSTAASWELVPSAVTECCGLARAPSQSFASRFGTVRCRFRYQRALTLIPAHSGAQRVLTLRPQACVLAQAPPRPFAGCFGTERGLPRHRHALAPALALSETQRALTLHFLVPRRQRVLTLTPACDMGAGWW